jgi:hypothetical protein
MGARVTAVEPGRRWNSAHFVVRARVLFSARVWSLRGPSSWSQSGFSGSRSNSSLCAR